MSRSADFSKGRRLYHYSRRPTIGERKQPGPNGQEGGANENMGQYEQVIAALLRGSAGRFVSNTENGRRIEVTGRSGGRYLCYDGGKLVTQVDDVMEAYAFFKGICGEGQI